MSDRKLSKIINRRDVLALFRATGTALFVVGCTSRQSHAQSTARNTLPKCIVSPEQTEGPYFVDEKLNRSDIRLDPSDGKIKEGVPLQLTLQVSGASNTSCTPIAGAIVDIWHCDALGVYSDVTDRSFNTIGKKFLRGYQVTDANGNVRFTTIYPGWYQGRTTHIHFKVRTTTSGQSYEFTSQLYFDDAVSDRVYTQAPYASKGQRTDNNEQDGIFRRGGDRLMLSLTENPQGGYAATFDIGLQTG